MQKRKFFHLIAAWTAGLVILSLGLPLGGWAQGKERVTLKATWVFTPKEAPYFLALDKGFFAAEGIDLDLQDGRGSGANIQLVTAKKLPLSLADLGTAAGFISQGAPIKAVWCYLRTTPMSVIAHADRGIRSPKDLEGKKLGAAPADAGKAIFTAVAEQNGVNLSRIQFVNVTPAARNTAFLNRDVDAIIAFFPDNAPFLRSKGASVNVLRYADFGVNTLGEGLIAHQSTLAEQGATIRRLLRAMNKSIEYALNHRDEAIASMRKHAPLVMKDPKLGRKVLDEFFSLLYTKTTEGKPIGWMAREDWNGTITILSQHGGLKNPLRPEDYYTNEFVPAKTGM